MLMFIYICQAPRFFQFTKKLYNWNSEKVYSVSYGVFYRLLVLCGCFLVVSGRLF